MNIQTDTFNIQLIIQFVAGCGEASKPSVPCGLFRGTGRLCFHIIKEHNLGTTKSI